MLLAKNGVDKMIDSFENKLDILKIRKYLFTSTLQHSHVVCNFICILNVIPSSSKVEDPTNFISPCICLFVCLCDGSFHFLCIWDGYWWKLYYVVYVWLRILYYNTMEIDLVMTWFLFFLHIYCKTHPDRGGWATAILIDLQEM